MVWSDLKLEVCTDFERGTKRIVEVVVVVVGISGGGGMMVSTTIGGGRTSDKFPYLTQSFSKIYPALSIHTKYL